ncbi:hypothetical protein JCM8097_006785 [Rhodosporidiobolus ruineniae]
MRFPSALAFLAVTASNALAAPLNRPVGDVSSLGAYLDSLDLPPPPPRSSMTAPASSATPSAITTSISSRMTPPADYTRPQPSSTSALAAFSSPFPPVAAATADIALSPGDTAAQLALAAVEHTDLRR